MIRVEVAFVSPDAQFLRELAMRPDSTITDAIVESGVEAECGICVDDLFIGIWSKPASPETRLRDGDRVEIYRPLKVDPKEARRRRARKPQR
jgi:putative ubiquitin-RnfH superfamily antitoxin RatB of RatAB toxin-antitoxin module